MSARGREGRAVVRLTVDGADTKGNLRGGRAAVKRIPNGAAAGLLFDILLIVVLYHTAVYAAMKFC